MMHWHVIRSKYHNEDLLCHQLHCRNIEVYYPCTYKRKAVSQARKMKPYFPGYLFVHVDLDTIARSDLQWIPGAVGLVCFGGEVAWVSDGVLEAIRMRVGQLNTEEDPVILSLHPGDNITILSGPFSGYRGIFASYLSDRERVIVFLKLLRDHQLRVELPVGQISSTKCASA